MVCSQRDKNTSPSSPRRWSLPSFSFSFSSFLLFFVDDLGCAVACPELAAVGAEAEDALEEPAEAASAASTLLPHRAQESSCSSTGATPSSTRKLTCRRKYRTAAGREDGGSAPCDSQARGQLLQTPGCLPPPSFLPKGCAGGHPEGFTTADTPGGSRSNDRVWLPAPTSMTAAMRLTSGPPQVPPADTYPVPPQHPTFSLQTLLSLGSLVFFAGQSAVCPACSWLYF